MRIEPKGLLADLLREKRPDALGGFDVDDDRLQRFLEESKSPSHAHMTEEERDANAIYAALTHPGWGAQKLRSEIDSDVATAAPTEHVRSFPWVWVWRFVVLAALAFLCVKASAQAPHDPIIIRAKDQGVTKATRIAGLFEIDCTTNMSCSWSGNTFTLTSSATAGTAWSSLTGPTTDLSMSHQAWTTTFTWGTGTSTSNLFTLQDTTGNTGTGYLFNVHSIGTSTLRPFRATAQGTANGVHMQSDAILRPLGTGAIYASQFVSDPTACLGDQWVIDIGADGGLTCSQPASTNLSDTADLVRNNASNTWSTGAQDFGAATSLKVPASAGAAPSASGLVAYDTTANLFKGGANAASKTFAFTDSNITGNAATATALAANGGDCSSGNAPLGVDASGAVENCFDVEEEGAINTTTVTGNAADDQVLLGSGAGALGYATIPNCNTDNSLTYNQSTNTIGCEADDSGGAPGTDSVGTDQLDDDANTPTAGDFVVVETGAASFDYVTPNAGTNVANDLEEEAQVGSTNVTGNAADDQVLLGSGANALAYATVPNCNTDNMLTYTQSTNTWGCEADDSGGAPAEDSVGTTELDDGADIPGSGEYIRVDTVDQAGIEYRTAAETRGDIGAASTSHATTHSDGGSDEVTATNLASACTDAQVLGGTAGGGVECQTDSTGTDTLDDLSDDNLGALQNVTESTPGNDEVLQYVTDHWENQTLTEAGIEATANKNQASGYAGLDGSTKLTQSQGQEVWGVADLSDFASKSGSGTAALGATITTPADNEYPKYSAGNWVNSTLAAAGIGSCTNQVATALNADAAPTCTTLTLASAYFANQGTTTTVLHGNASGNPSFGAVVVEDVEAELKTEMKTIVVLSPTTSETNLAQLKFAYPVTIQRVSCSTDVATSTVTIQLDERAEGTPNTAGTNVMTASLVCDTDTQATTAFDNAGIAADAPLNLQITATANSPGVVRIHIDYAID